MKFKKVNIVFTSNKIREKDIFAVYEYGDFLIAQFQYYSSNLSYNFGQQRYGGFKKSWGIFNKENYKFYASKGTRKECKKVIDRLIASGKTFGELNEKEHLKIVQWES